MKNKSQKLYSKMIATALLAGTVLLPTTAGAAKSNLVTTNNTVAALPGLVTVASTDTSSIDTSKISFTNNVGKTDEIKGAASSVPAKAAVKIYASSADSAPVIAKGTAAADGSFTAKGAVLPSVETTLFVSTTVNKVTSAKSSFAYTSASFEAVSSPPSASVIKVTNTLKSDIVEITSGLAVKDVVKVYAADGRTLLGSASAKDGKATVKLKSQLTDDLSQKIHVSVTSTNKRESELTPFSLATSKEPVTSAPTAVVLTNNLAPVADVVKVSGVTAKDVVKVYATTFHPISDAPIEVLLGSATAKDTTVDVKLKLQVPDRATRIYATATSKDKQESSIVENEVTAVAVTSPTTATVTLDAKGKKLTVTAVEAGATVNVYADDQRTLLGSKKGKTAGEQVAVGLKLPLAKFVGETIYVGQTVAGKLESDLTAYRYDGTNWTIVTTP